MLVSARQQGFNLIEAVVTMAILGLLIALMAPGVAGWIRNIQVRNAAESATAGLQKARMEALRRNKAVTFWLVTANSSGTLDSSCALSSGSISWVISVEDPTSKCDTAPSATTSPMIVEAFGASKGASSLTVAGVASDGTTAANSVAFNALGQVVQTGTPLARINISHPVSGARNLSVIVSPGGSARMCDQGVAVGDARAC